MRNLLLYSILSIFMSFTTSSFGISCIGTINTSIDASGQVTLPLSALLTDRCFSCRYTMSRPATFDCSDVDTRVAILITETNLFSGRSTSCIVNVNIVNKQLINPCVGPIIYCRSNVNAEINSSGYAELSPEDVLARIDPGITYRVEPSRFECYEAGTTVTTRVYGVNAGGLENYCVFNVRVLDNRVSAPPCVRMLSEGIDFLPGDRIELPFVPGASINFVFAMFAQSSKNTNLAFKYQLSHSPNTSPNNPVLFGNNIVLRKGLSINGLKGKLTIPVNTQPGKYFLIASLAGANGQVDISLKPYIQEIVVKQGNGNQSIVSQGPHQSFVYPNPAVDHLMILNEENTFKSGYIYDQQGNLQHKFTLTSQENTIIDIAKLRPGMHIMCLYDDCGLMTKQSFIKQE